MDVAPDEPCKDITTDAREGGGGGKKKEERIRSPEQLIRPKNFPYNLITLFFALVSWVLHFITKIG